MECSSNLIKSLFPHYSDLSSYRRYTKHTKAQIVACEEPGNLFTSQDCSSSQANMLLMCCVFSIPK